MFPLNSIISQPLCAFSRQVQCRFSENMIVLDKYRSIWLSLTSFCCIKSTSSMLAVRLSSIYCKTSSTTLFYFILTSYNWFLLSPHYGSINIVSITTKHSILPLNYNNNNKKIVLGNNFQH